MATSPWSLKRLLEKARCNALAELSRHGNHLTGPEPYTRASQFRLVTGNATDAPMRPIGGPPTPLRPTSAGDFGGPGAGSAGDPHQIISQPKCATRVRPRGSYSSIGADPQFYRCRSASSIGGRIKVRSARVGNRGPFGGQLAARSQESNDINWLTHDYGGSLRQRRASMRRFVAALDAFRRPCQATWGSAAGFAGEPHQDNKPRYALPQF